MKVAERTQTRYSCVMSRRASVKLTRHIHLCSPAVSPKRGCGGAVGWCPPGSDWLVGPAGKWPSTMGDRVVWGASLGLHRFGPPDTAPLLPSPPLAACLSSPPRWLRSSSTRRLSPAVHPSLGPPCRPAPRPLLSGPRLVCTQFPWWLSGRAQRNSCGAQSNRIVG